MLFQGGNLVIVGPCGQRKSGKSFLLNMSGDFFDPFCVQVAEQEGKGERGQEDC